MGLQTGYWTGTGSYTPTAHFASESSTFPPEVGGTVFSECPSSSASSLHWSRRLRITRLVKTVHPRWESLFGRTQRGSVLSRHLMLHVPGPSSRRGVGTGAPVPLPIHPPPFTSVASSCGRDSVI